MRRRPPVGVRGPVEIAVDVVAHPSGVRGVLVQLPDSYVVIPSAEQARAVAALILDTAAILDRLVEGENGDLPPSERPDNVVPLPRRESPGNGDRRPPGR